MKINIAIFVIRLGEICCLDRLNKYHQAVFRLKSILCVTKNYLHFTANHLFFRK